MCLRAAKIAVALNQVNAVTNFYIPCTSCIRRRRTYSAGPIPSCSAQDMRKGLSRDAECRRDFSDQDMPLRLSFQQSLEASDDVLVLTCGAGRLDRGTVRETFDNGFDQLLLQSMRGFPVDGCVRSAFDRRSIASIPAE